MTFESTLVPLTTLFLIAALGLPQVAESQTAAQTGPINIGFLTVRTGPLAAGGEQMEEASSSFSRSTTTRSPGARSSSS
jgi:branched-chain amino acid transport system substrate-binding protein